MKSSKKIRVLEMIDDASIGGGQVHVLMLAKYLDRELFEVFVACGSEGYLVNELHTAGITMIPVSLDNSIRLKNFREVYDLFRNSTFDILHTHGGTAGFWGRLGAIFSPHRPARIHTYHGMHYLSRDSPLPSSLSFIDKFLLHLTDRVVCVCQSDFEKGLKAGIVSKSKGVVIHNGIEVERFQRSRRREALRAEFGLDESTIVFGNVGRLHIQKGQQYLLKAFDHVRRQQPNCNLWFIGDGDLRHDLEKLAHDLNIVDSVRFLGVRTDIPDLLTAIDVFVLPSLWEGQPVSLLEAMTAGKPVIASNVDGIVDILVNEENGLLVPTKDSVRLAKAMLRLACEKSLRDSLSAAALASVFDRFSVQEMARRVGKLYYEVYMERFEMQQ